MNVVGILVVAAAGMAYMLAMCADQPHWAIPATLVAGAALLACGVEPGAWLYLFGAVAVAVTTHHSIQFHRTHRPPVREVTPWRTS